MSLESPVERPRIVERAWMRQIYAPYLRGAVWPSQWARTHCASGAAPGIDIDESDDEFDWGDFDSSFDEHLVASLFSTVDGPEFDVIVGDLVEPEPVTAFVDVRTNQLTAVVHEDGEVEYIDGHVLHTP